METYHDKHEILSGRVLLYRRLDHKGMVGKTYQMRIKVPDRKGFIVLSTKTADLNEAIATATDRLAELTHKQRTGIPGPLASIGRNGTKDRLTGIHGLAQHDVSGTSVIIIVISNPFSAQKIFLKSPSMKPTAIGPGASAIGKAVLAKRSKKPIPDASEPKPSAVIMPRKHPHKRRCSWSNQLSIRYLLMRC